MKAHVRLLVGALGVLLIFSVLPGCGVSKVKIHGKLTKNGQPFNVSEETLVTLMFIADIDEQNQTQTYPARFKQETGTYEIEVPPGKYQTTYVIVEKNQAPLTAPLEMRKKTHDLTRNQELDIEIGAK